MKKDSSKIQKQASLLVFCLIFLFSNHPSNNTGSPLKEAKGKAVKVVNFVAMWLNLYPRTVIGQLKCATKKEGKIEQVTPFLSIKPKIKCILEAM